MYHAVDPNSLTMSSSNSDVDLANGMLLNQTIGAMSAPTQTLFNYQYNTSFPKNIAQTSQRLGYMPVNGNILPLVMPITSLSVPAMSSAAYAYDSSATTILATSANGVELMNSARVAAQFYGVFGPFWYIDADNIDSLSGPISKLQGLTTLIIDDHVAYDAFNPNVSYQEFGGGMHFGERQLSLMIRFGV